MGFEPFAGMLLEGRWQLDRRIGAGGMGEVWAATHTITRKRVALKFLRQFPEPERVDLTRRFLREARAACAVEHPSIVQVFDVLELADGTPMMVMELLSGESLQEKLDRDGRLDVDVAASILLPVVSAVGAAHAAGVVHRDLKPDNIFLARGADGRTTVKVLDFGLAKFRTGAGAGASAVLTALGAVLGTPCYMSPEQAAGERDVDHRSDVWSLGMVLYECISGVLPTERENIGQVMKILLAGPIPPVADVAPGLPRDLCALVDRMLTRDREARAQGLGEVYEVLARHAAPRVPAPAPARPLAKDTIPLATLPPAVPAPADVASDDTAATRPLALVARRPAAPPAHAEAPAPHADARPPATPPARAMTLGRGAALVGAGLAVVALGVGARAIVGASRAAAPTESPATAAVTSSSPSVAAPAPTPEVPPTVSTPAPPPASSAATPPPSSAAPAAASASATATWNVPSPSRTPRAAPPRPAAHRPL